MERFSTAKVDEPIVLSILICHMLTRKEQLNILKLVLDSQCKDKPVEYLVCADNGEQPIGAKRNELLYAAGGKYVAFVDDDDMVAENYVDEILQALESVKDADAVGISGYISDSKDGVKQEFHHSIFYAGWYEANGVYYRTPNHLNPIRRSIALSVRFPPAMRFGEDACYSNGIQRYIKVEARTHSILYYYVPSTLTQIQKESAA